MIDCAKETARTITTKWSWYMDNGETAVADVDWRHTCGRTLCVEETELAGVARIQSVEPGEDFSGWRERLTSYLVVGFGEDGGRNEVYVSLFTTEESVFLGWVQGKREGWFRGDCQTRLCGFDGGGVVGGGCWWGIWCRVDGGGCCRTSGY